MYKLPYFKEKDVQKVIDFMQQQSFAVITGNGTDFPVATQIPLLIEQVADKIFLKGHLMKNTDHHKAFMLNKNVLVLFTGPHCYVSASWYADAQTASTWNYMTVHAKGKINFTDDIGTIEAVKLLTNYYEAADSIASFNQIPTTYVDKLIHAIVGFTIEVESIDNVFKLSQNKAIDEQKNIIHHLQKSNNFQAKEIAVEMEKRL
jgi:transcriptional regulator